MRRDPTDFRKRFAAYKLGQKPYLAGRPVEEEWTMQDEAGYNEWKSHLAPNLRYTDELVYDMRGAYKSGAQQELYEDGYYHLPSRDPNTGKFLKKPTHKTFLEGLAVDMDMGYVPYQKNHVVYTEPGWGLTFKDRLPKYEH